MEDQEACKPSSEGDRNVAVAKKPWFVYFLLAGAVLSVSSGPVAFHSMAEISPILLAFWRLQVTVLVLIPLGVHSIYAMPKGDRQKALQSWKPVLGSGLLLGLFYSSWVTCILNTSVTHALLAGSSPPIIIAVWTLVMRQPISAGELVGTGIAGVGCVFIAMSAGGKEREVTALGDLLGIFAHVVFVIYLAIGRGLRVWLPLFAYVLPMHAITALVLFCAALGFEGVGFNTSPSGLFGLYGSWSYLWRSVYLGAVPGVVGMVSFTAVLKWLHPLVVALPGTMEPLFGSFLGLALGVAGVPGLYTCIGGAILIASTVVVIVSSYRREQKAAAEGQKKPSPAGDVEACRDGSGGVARHKLPSADNRDQESEREPFLASPAALGLQVEMVTSESRDSESGVATQCIESEHSGGKQ